MGGCGIDWYISIGSYTIPNHDKRSNCFSKIQLVGQKDIETKHVALVKARL